jgi:3-hexulose-6-phosphate synthase
VDIIEIGTPLIIEEGLHALEAIKARFPDKKYLADLKVMDAGKIEAASGFIRGADIVTVLAAADDLTIRGALEAAEASGGQVMVDLINLLDPPGRASHLCAMGVPIICCHTAVDLEGAAGVNFGAVQTIRKIVRSQLAVAGGLNLEIADQALSSGADILVIGRGITDQPSPRQAARRLRWSGFERSTCGS